MKRINLDQKSPDWLQWRNAGIGSSDAAVIWYGKHFQRTIKDLWEEKVIHYHVGKQGSKPEKRSEWAIGAMARGTRLEPEARRLYEEWIGHEAKPLCAVHDEHEFLKASCDGFIEALNVVVEIKAPNRDDHNCALNSEVPDKYKPQCDHLMLVTGARFCHYVSFSDYFEGWDQLGVVKWDRDEDRMKILLAKETAFWKSVVEGTEP